MQSLATISLDSTVDDQDASGTYWSRSVEGELASIREDVLVLAILGMPVLGLVWLAIAMPDDLVPLGAASRPVFALFVGALGAYYLRRWSRVAASWLVVISMIVAVSNMIAGRTSPMAITAGILIVVTANALLGPLESALATVTAAAALTVARHLVFGGLPWWIGFDVLLLYGLVWGAVYAGSLQVRRAFEISAAGWAHSRALLRELRSRRAELHKLVTAQRESAYRLERMNRELVKARREAEHARKTKEQLVATISHELRGPLNLILGYSRILALSPESYDQELPAVYRRDIDVIYRNSQQLSSLIDDVLDLSRAEADSLPLVKDEVRLKEDVIDRVVGAVEPLISRKGLDLRLRVESDLPSILGDAVRLRQILINLVSNAARLTEQGSIGIGARLDDGHLMVTVTDTGPGIPADKISRLFTPFTTLRPGDPTASGGAGLGLSISKRLVEIHGGDMWVESVEGEGSTFAFTLPVLGELPRARGLTRLGDATPRRQLRDACLVIGDDPQLLRTLARYMPDLDVAGIPPNKGLAAAVQSLRPVGLVGSEQQIAHLHDDADSIPEMPMTIALPMGFGLGERYGPTLAYLVKPISEEILSAALRPLDLRPDMRALVVDDDPDAVRLLSRLLLEVTPQCEISTAYGGAEALGKMDERRPDLVLLDLLMPEVSGQDVMGHMANDARLARVPIIVISARDEPDADRLVRGTIQVELPASTPVVRVASWINETLRRLPRTQAHHSGPRPASAEARPG